MPGTQKKKNKKLFGKKTPETELYYHQIFFHYVLQDGQRAHPVHGIEHDEGTTFEYPTYQYQIKDTNILGVQEERIT